MKDQEDLIDNIYKSSKGYVSLVEIDDALFKVINILFKNIMPALMYDELVMWWIYEEGRILWEKDKDTGEEIEIKLETVEDLYNYCLSNLNCYKEYNSKDV